VVLCQQGKAVGAFIEIRRDAESASPINLGVELFFTKSGMMAY